MHKLALCQRAFVIDLHEDRFTVTVTDAFLFRLRKKYHLYRSVLAGGPSAPLTTHGYGRRIAGLATIRLFARSVPECEPRPARHVSPNPLSLLGKPCRVISTACLGYSGDVPVPSKVRVTDSMFAAFTASPHKLLRYPVHAHARRTPPGLAVAAVCMNADATSLCKPVSCTFCG